MRLLEAILAANQRRCAGDASARVDLAEQAAALPFAALTCIDPRLNHLLPDSLGLPEERFVWLRNAGNIITGPLSSTMRSLALGCAIKGAKEIAIIGHSDCQVGKTTMLQLLDQFGKLGVDRHRLPENLVEYFGLFSSERQNVLRSVDHARHSPLIGANVPVHGLLIDVASGRLECVVNGYDAPPVTAPAPGKAGEVLGRIDSSLQKLERIGQAAADEFPVPTHKIGEIASVAHDWLDRAEKVVAAVTPTPKPPPSGPTPANPPPPIASPTAKTPQPPTFAQWTEKARQLTARNRPKDPRKGR